MKRFVRASWWDGPRLRWDASDEDGHPAAFATRGAFAWDVSERQTAPPVPAWVFEPKRPAAGTRLPVDAVPEERTWDPLCEEPHTVYLAFFGTLPKIGMTLATRLEARLREQGADAGFPIATVADREAARVLERTLSVRHRVPEARRAREVLARLARPRDEGRIERAVAAWRARVGSTDAGAIHVRDPPLARPLPAVPRWTPAPGHHEGRWIGALGNHVFYEDASAGRLDVGGAPVWALRRQDLVGRWVESRPALT